MSFSVAPSDPPPPPPLPLNIKRAQHRTQIEDAEREAEGTEALRDFEDVGMACTCSLAIADGREVEL
jgi:hypothetical protein